MTFAEMTTGARQTRGAGASALSIEDRLAALDWDHIAASLDEDGCAVTGPVLSAEECRLLAATYRDDARFRSRVVMARHGFGRGEYKSTLRPAGTRTAPPSSPDLVSDARRA